MIKNQFLFVVGILFLVGCRPAGDAASSEVTPTIPLIIYQTPTLTPVVPTATLAVEPTTPPLPTITPFIYTVVQNDTLIGIASRFGITLDELLAANPSVDPRFLSVGAALIIPSGEGGPVSAQPTPTPVALVLHEVLCYPTSAGGVWCFWLVENRGEQGVENISGLVTIWDAEGGQVAAKTALTPLNVIGAQEAQPLVVYFDSGAVDFESATGQLLTGLAVPQDTERYLTAELVDVKVEVSASGLQAEVTGQVLLMDGESPPASLIWIAAVAYDAEGNVVGVRRWESDAGLEGGEGRAFSILVYSLGPTIDRVDLFVEARP